MGPLVIVPVAAVAIYEGGKFLGLWGAPTPKKMPPPGVITTTSDGRPIATGVPAVDMNNLLKFEGYKLLDQPAYKAFQRSAGLVADGFPGMATMGALKTVLQAKGVPQQEVFAGPVYSFAKATGFDGIHAPTVAEWTRGMPASHPATSNPPVPANAEGGMPHPDQGGPNAVLTSTGYVSPAAAIAGAGGQVLDAAEAAQQAALAGARSGVLAEIEATAKAAEAAVGG